MIHDASLGRGNVDHILIGPAGVFTVETKSHPGPIRVAHASTASHARARRSAQRRAIERVTGLEVEPLIVYSRAWVDRPLARRKGVRVVPARMLLGYLAKLRARLSPVEIERAHELVAQALLEQHARGRSPRRAPASGACPSAPGAARARRALALMLNMAISPFARDRRRRTASAGAPAWRC